MMNAILRCTPSSCFVCPELSEGFPDPNVPDRKSIIGEVDFYLNGSLCWGIEFLVKGVRIGEHLDRFSSNGKYSGLGSVDYAVIDFRPGPVSNVPSIFQRIIQDVWTWKSSNIDFGRLSLNLHFV
jgi:hypothetical protein